MTRSSFIRMAVGASAGSAAQRVFLGQQAAPPRPYSYKTAGGCEIHADVYGADARTRKPAVIWIHGGALINGSRKSISGGFHSGLLKQGYVVVSIDYRLAPETKLPAIIEDVRDAHKWVRKSGPNLFQIDPAPVALAGSSAG